MTGYEDNCVIPARVTAALQSLNYLHPAAFREESGIGPPALTSEQRELELDAIRVVREYLNSKPTME